MFRGMWTILQLLLLAFWAAGGPVTIPGLGDVIGTTSKSSKGNDIYSFYAIPYALPLTGDIRFKKPVPQPPWRKPLDCQVSGPACPQPETFISEFTPNGTAGVKKTSHDCLHLDVHTRSVTAGDVKLPVLVFFHGSGFTTGSSASIKPDFLLDHELVLVVPQFRLGVLGLLNLGSDYIPGNAALFDQNLALKWVKDNIASFNGDPDKVTIAGHSTGAALATLHMFSPLSTGLFSQVIAHGGAGIASWAITEDQMSGTAGLAGKLNCPIGDWQVVENCIKDRTTQELVDSYTSTLEEVPLRAVVQPSNKAAFIKKNPFDSLRDQKYNFVPILAGFNKHEGMLFTEFLYKLMVKYNLHEDKNFLKNELVRKISQNYNVPDTSGVLADALTKRYFNESELGDLKAMYNGLIDLTGSAFAKGSIYRLVQFNSEISSTYLYAFNYYSKNHLTDHIFGKPDGDGVMHGDELMYLFPQEGITLNKEEKKMSETLTQIWADFVIHGNPAPAKRDIPGWTEYKKEDDSYLVIANDGLKIAKGFRQQLTITHDNGLEFQHSGGHISSQISLAVLSITACFILFR